MKYNEVRKHSKEAYMNVIHHAIELILPYVISVLEVVGIFVVTWAAIKGFWQYIQSAFTKKKPDLQANLARGLATGLEFKMAAEILKTVIIQNMEELYMLGAVILLRALLSVMIHFELKNTQREAISTAEQEETKN